MVGPHWCRTPSSKTVEQEVRAAVEKRPKYPNCVGVTDWAKKVSLGANELTCGFALALN